MKLITVIDLMMTMNEVKITKKQTKNEKQSELHTRRGEFYEEKL